MVHRVLVRGILLACLLLTVVGTAGAAEPEGLEIGISFEAAVASEPIDGRVLLVFAVDDGAEPRFQVRAGVQAVQVFGVDVEGLAPGEEAVIDGSVFGYPIASLAGVGCSDHLTRARMTPARMAVWSV